MLVVKVIYYARDDFVFESDEFEIVSSRIRYTRFSNKIMIVH